MLEGRNKVLPTRLEACHVFTDYFLVKDNITLHISGSTASRDIPSTVVRIPCLKLDSLIVIIERASSIALMTLQTVRLEK